VLHATPLARLAGSRYTRIVAPDRATAFDAMAASYDELEPWYEHLYAVLHARLRTSLAPPVGSGPRRALDAGCGTGFQTAILLDLGYDTVGLDLSAALLATARRRHPRARLARGDLEALPWRDGTFDVAVSCGSTLSFVARPDRALVELGRVLRPGGHLLLEVEHRWSLDLLWRLASGVLGDPLRYGATAGQALRAFGPPLAGGIWLDYPGYPQLRLFTRPELGRLLAGASLVAERAWGIHSITNLIPSPVLHRPRLPPALARGYGALCRLDRLLAPAAPARWTANSLVILARRAGAPDDAGRRAVLRRGDPAAGAA
jgi:SAM-dependent methyltransferase